MLKPRSRIRFFIYLEIFLYVGEGFEEIDFSGEGAGVAVAAVEVEDDGVARLEVAWVADAVPEEIDFAEGFAAAVKPGVYAPVVGAVGCVRGWDYEAVGLDTAVDFRNVASDDEAGGFGPRGVAVGELVGAFVG